MSEATCMAFVLTPLFRRPEAGGDHLPHAETPPHCGATRDVQLRGDAVHGV